MVEFAAVTYGMLTSFVLSSASRNKRTATPNPRIVEIFGWLLVGLSIGGALGAVGYGSMELMSA